MPFYHQNSHFPFSLQLSTAQVSKQGFPGGPKLAALENHAMDNWTNLEQESVLTVQIPYYPDRPWELKVVLTGCLYV